MATEKNNIALKVAALAEKARDGNRMSFQELVSIFQEDIHRLVYYRTYSQMDAEDITQEVFVQAYRKLKSLNDTQRFRPWLYSIAVNRCNDFLRKRKLLSLLQFKSAQEQEFMETGKGMSNNYNETIAKKRFWKQVRSLLDKLSAMEREVFTLRFMDHRNINEIAAILDKNESTVKTHLYRALNKVRKDSVFFQEYRESLS
ncbi:MAG: sigma-70 family RNA polymerase sigma factor [Desulfobacterales bacterium]|jgi:RNA polymerase sigma-70 factor (ECF subfamily)|nr:RNA polymerase sigma factor [Desulfobacterales bacterium]NOQ65665.1 sigma-70 family RNA polymerase sigma factor [Desulfobacterales bacterium]